MYANNNGGGSREGVQGTRTSILFIGQAEVYGAKKYLFSRPGPLHPRRPRGSLSGREKRRNESFLVRAKEPLGTDSH